MNSSKSPETVQLLYRFENNKFATDVKNIAIHPNSDTVISKKRNF